MKKSRIIRIDSLSKKQFFDIVNDVDTFMCHVEVRQIFLP